MQAGEFPPHEDEHPDDESRTPPHGDELLEGEPGAAPGEGDDGDDEGPAAA